MEKIQTLWVKGKIGKMEKLSLKSFLEKGHDVNLYTYGSVNNVPEGVKVVDGREIIKEEEIFTYNEGGFGGKTFSGFANEFRLNLLYKKGGWWVDTDVICVKPFDFDDKRVVATSYEHEWGNCAINCVMKLPKKDPILKYCIKRTEKMNKEEIEHGENGPHLLQEAIRELGEESVLVGPDVFCPIGWRDVEMFVNPKIYRSLVNFKRYVEGRGNLAWVGGKSYAIHLWNQAWKEAGIEKEDSHPQTSIYERKKLAHGIE